jgi:hypothetical protein
LIGAVWGAAGILIIIDAMDGVTYFPLHVFAAVLLLEGLALSGYGLIRVSLRLRRLPPYASVSLLTGRHGNETFSPLVMARAQPTAEAPIPLTVHVWTPVGSSEGAVRRPIIDRYAAAVDAHGVISTGHAALEVAPEIYISHYPGTEIERSPDQFMQTLKATPENDVPGLFQPNYHDEAADTMAWTPGLTLDYSRALHSVVHPPDVGWLLLVRAGLKAYSNRAQQSIKRAAKSTH